MKDYPRTLTSIVLLITLFLLAACGGASATPTPAPAPASPTATAEPVATTETITPTESIEVTDTTAVSETAPVSETTSVSETAPVSETTSVSETETISETTPVSGTTESFTDPFAYCAAVGTVDAPAAPYVGEDVPEGVTKGLQVALGTDAPLDELSAGIFWRCVDQQVYACFVGANLPCTEKANTSDVPTQAELDFCAEAANANAENIPAYVTGHNTVYAWRCTDGKPEVVEQVAETDAQGFIAGIWYALPAP